MSGKAIAISRGVAIIGGTAAIMVGATFAAITSNPVTLVGNTISTATANLQIWNGGAFDVTAPGFAVTGLIPGHRSGPHTFYLKNNGDGDLALTATVPTLPGPPAGGFGFSGYENVLVRIVDQNSGAITDTNLQALHDGDVDLSSVLPAGAQGNTGVSGTKGNYVVYFDINPGAISGSSAGVGAFDIVINGTVPGSEAPTPSPI